MGSSVFVQAGGQSRRMGQNKALMPFLGRPLIQRVIERITTVAAEIVIISNEPQPYEFLNLPIIPDEIPGKGALGGLYTSLLAARHSFVIPVACDMPFINSILLQAEIEILQANHADVVIPESVNGLEPLHAVYRRETCLPYVRDALLRDQRRLVGWFEHVNVLELKAQDIAAYDPANRAFININTPEDLLHAESLASSET